jgi:hypothetical protein
MASRFTTQHFTDQKFRDFAAKEAIVGSNVCIFYIRVMYRYVLSPYRVILFVLTFRGIIYMDVIDR